MVAELLFSQQPRKLWIMSVAVLGKQVQWSSQSIMPKARSDVCLLWAVGVGDEMGGLDRRIAGSFSIRAGENLEVVVIFKTGKLRP